MNQSIKVGNYRIQLNNISHVAERISENLYKSEFTASGWTEDTYPRKDSTPQSGLIVTVTFNATGGEYDQYVTLYVEQAETFLAIYDRIMETVEA
jgi:hypothetical protein